MPCFLNPLVNELNIHFITTCNVNIALRNYGNNFTVIEVHIENAVLHHVRVKVCKIDVISGIVFSTCSQQAIEKSGSQRTQETATISPWHPRCPGNHGQSH